MLNEEQGATMTFTKFKDLEKYINANRVGNHNSDRELFEAIDEFIAANAEVNREEAKKAISLIDLLMGENPGEVTDQDLTDYLQEGGLTVNASALLREHGIEVKDCQVASKDRAKAVATIVALGREALAMTNLLRNRTGIDGVVIWVSPGEFAGKASVHGPRVKVALGNKTNTENLKGAATVTLETSPRIIGGELPAWAKKAVFKFIGLNLEVLLKFWDEGGDPVDLVLSLKPVSQEVTR